MYVTYGMYMYSIEYMIDCLRNVVVAIYHIIVIMMVKTIDRMCQRKIIRPIVAS